MPIATGTSVTVAPLATESYFVRAEGLCDTTGCAKFEIVVQNSVSASWADPDSICLDAGLIDLSSFLFSGSTPGGNWIGVGVTDSTFDPKINGLGLVTITYSVGISPCVDTQSHTIRIYESIPVNIIDDYISVTVGRTDTLEVESNDLSLGTISINVLPQFGGSYIVNNRNHNRGSHCIFNII